MLKNSAHLAGVAAIAIAGTASVELSGVEELRVPPEMSEFVPRFERVEVLDAEGNVDFQVRELGVLDALISGLGSALDAASGGSHEWYRIHATPSWDLKSPATLEEAHVKPKVDEQK